ncbi:MULTISPECIES: hypothetical protein [Ferrimonas]|uniref:hypothetical protein n=1 Tax=Ferrimonas TaxID=44011 RepID=UPI0003FB206E|nr:MULTISPECIES: hypothetical protein [Ferrimonas]USD39320.1 hypothetical protein J8Z22_09610 [Ferrimonas sp. SCSIO 43195]
MTQATVEHISLEMIATYAKWCGIHSREQWQSYHQHHVRPSWVPDDPEAFFNQYGEWPGWASLTAGGDVNH